MRFLDDGEKRCRGSVTSHNIFDNIFKIDDDVAVMLNNIGGTVAPPHHNRGNEGPYLAAFPSAHSYRQVPPL